MAFPAGGVPVRRCDGSVRASSVLSTMTVCIPACAARAPLRCFCESGVRMVAPTGSSCSRPDEISHLRMLGRDSGVSLCAARSLSCLGSAAAAGAHDQLVAGDAPFGFVCQDAGDGCGR